MCTVVWLTWSLASVSPELPLPGEVPPKLQRRSCRPGCWGPPTQLSSLLWRDPGSFGRFCLAGGHGMRGGRAGMQGPGWQALVLNSGITG